jgi:hypothetical protein
VLDELPKHLVVGTSVESLCTGEAVRRDNELEPGRTATALDLTCGLFLDAGRLSYDTPCRGAGSGRRGLSARNRDRALVDRSPLPTADAVLR